MSIIETHELVKVYQSASGEIHALDGLNIEVPKGATALLGPNGSGKSTLIKIILGLLRPTSGSYTLFGMDDKKLARNMVGYMPETPSIISKVNAVKYVRHFGILSGLSFTRAMQRAHETLDYVGLEDRYRDIDDYSTGMKQRLLFAQALVHDPEVLILDEPTTGLSPEGREEMLGLIREINSNYGKSIVFSTHILQDVENITNYSVLIQNGRRVFEGTAEEVQQLYAEELIIEPDRNIDSASRILADNGYINDLTGRRIHIHADQISIPIPTMSDIISILKPEGIGVLSVRRRKPNLEDLFLKTIEKDIDQ